MMDRSRERYHGNGDWYRDSDDAVRVNVYGSSGTTDHELDTAVDGAESLLQELYNAESLSGFRLYGYQTDVSLSQDIDDGHHDLINKGYDAIEGSPYEDEHAVVLWVYWNHESDSSDCGPFGDDDPCPDVFMMGHDVDCSWPFNAWHRQPYKYVSSTYASYCDIQQGFVYLNEFETDIDGISTAHELGHALVTRDDGRVAAMVPDEDDQNQHGDHYLGTRHGSWHSGYWNTIMATGSNPDAVENGECDSSSSSDNEQIGSSSCTIDAVEYSADWFSSNTTLTTDSCNCR